MTRQRLTVLAVTFALLGGVATPAASAHASQHHARTFSFLAQVVRSSSSGLLVKKEKGGQTVWFPASQIIQHRASTGKRHKGSKHAARAAEATTTTPSVTINIVGLQPGAKIVITETIAANGDITITITLPPAGTTPTSEQHATGVVDEVDDSDFYLDPGDGNDLEFNMDADALSNLNLQQCNTVNVTYHQDAGVLIADTVTITGWSTTGDCAPTYDVDGTITQVSGSGLSIQSDQGPMSFVVDSSDITDGFSVGDVVDVTYTQESGNTLDASDVEYVENDDTGIVTHVTTNRLTIADSTTGEPDVFVADPNGLQLNTDAFTGIAIGDSVDVCYHQTAAGLIADTVTDSGPSGYTPPGSGSTGSTGTTGATGSTGSTGNTGSTGSTGNTGSHGSH
jgi:hypothetical protein